MQGYSELAIDVHPPNVELFGIDNWVQQILGEVVKPLYEKFENEVDWLQAKELFELKTVAALDSRKGCRKQGVGRVLSGPEAIERIWRKKGGSFG